MGRGWGRHTGAPSQRGPREMGQRQRERYRVALHAQMGLPATYLSGESWKTGDIHETSIWVIFAAF